MNKMSAGGVFLLCLFVGIIFGEVAWGILGGFFLTAIVGKATAKPPADNADA